MSRTFLARLHSSSTAALPCSAAPPAAQAASQTRARQGRLAVCLTVHIYCSWQRRHWHWSLSYTGPEYFLSVSLEQIKFMVYKAKEEANKE